MSTPIERHVEILLFQLDKLEAENETLQTRIEDLTVWRPMDTAPRDDSYIRVFEDGVEDIVSGYWSSGEWRYSNGINDFPPDSLHGWLPTQVEP